MHNFHPTGRQLAAGRALIGMTQSELSALASISVPTLKRMEASAGTASGLPNNVAAVRRALENAGVIFVPADGEGPGVRLRMERSVQSGIRPEDLNAANDD